MGEMKPTGAYEAQHAVMDAHRTEAADRYFAARPQIDCNDRRKVFEAAYKMAWEESRSLLESGESAASSAMGDDGTRRQAREVAELFRGFTKSSHRFHDGRPLHLVAAELLEALAASPSPSNEREGK
jgi:hypothetical protein